MAPTTMMMTCGSVSVASSAIAARGGRSAAINPSVSRRDAVIVNVNAASSDKSSDSASTAQPGSVVGDDRVSLGRRKAIIAGLIAVPAALPVSRQCHRPERAS